ncbi:MAG: sugar transferase [Polyangiales bacterium]
MFDLLLAVPVGLVFLPLGAFVAVLIATTMGRPVIFRQERPGLRERPFRLLKFRTMRDDRDGHGELLSDAERLTKTGAFLRKTSLDELPTLINVIAGDMSFVGPRPLLMQYLPLYSAEQKRRHDVRPGVTGWAQVNGRNAITWSKKFEFDVQYVDRVSFLFDLRILMRTAVHVFAQRGVSANDHVTMPVFEGNDDR